MRRRLGLGAGLCWVSLIGGCYTEHITGPEPVAQAQSTAPPLTEVRLPILTVQSAFRWDTEFRGLATAAIEAGLYDLPGVLPVVSNQIPSPGAQLSTIARRVVDARFSVTGPADALDLSLELCIAGGSCEVTTAHCRREDPWAAFGILLAGAAQTLNLSVPEATVAAWSQPGSRDNYAELLTGRSAAMYYGIMSLPDPIPTGNSHPALRAVVVDPRQPLAQWIWARWQTGAESDAGRAPDALGRAALQRPGSPLYLAERAWLLDHTGHAEEARLIWEDLYKDYPDDPRFMEPYARVLLETGHAADAREVLSKFPPEFLWDAQVARLQAQVVEAVDGTANLDPLLAHWQQTDSHAVEPVRRRIELRVQNAEYDSALSLMGALRVRAPGPQADALEAALLVALGRLDDAQALSPEEVAARLSLRGALEADPGADVGYGEEDTTALLARAAAALWRADPETALSLINQARCGGHRTDENLSVTCVNERPELWMLQAKALEQVGRSGEAVSAWQRAWQSDPALEGGPVSTERIAPTFHYTVAAAVEPAPAPPKTGRSR